jgi:ATP-dependent helicase HrpA
MLDGMAIAADSDLKITYPPELPVSARRDDLLAAIGANQVVIVAGETGSGKTTQLPKICLELGRRSIAHTQPRRIAARTVATRIAEELGVQLGGAVGYAVRFDDRTGRNTQVRLVTDGLLLAEIQRDRFLRRYDMIILDEAHERSLNIDFLLGFLKQLLPRRPDLKLVITSATIDTARFSEHFGGAPVVEVSGRTYPVEVRYRPAAEQDDPVDAIGDAVEELLDDAPGDVLVFLSGEREIRDTAEALAARLPTEVGVLPLYARLSPAEQQKVFSRHSERRVVLATNVAETSLTVPGIGAVVDPGTARISRYSARLKVQRLPIEPVSQASANQRKGRCGRTSDGICVRLYSEEDFYERPAFTDPEILRTSLASVILQMASLGLGEVEDFGFLDPPDRRQIRDGKALLHELGALDPEAKDSRKRLTALGRKLAHLPVDPRIGRMVLEAGKAGCADEVVVIAAALSIQDPRIRPTEKRAEADELHARFVDGDARSDFLAYLNLWRHLRARQKEMSRNGFRRMCHAEYLHYMRVREWQDLAGQLRQAARNVGVTINEQPAAPDDVHRALLAGLLSHVGLRNGASREYDGVRGARFTLSPGSALARKPPVWVMVAELVETARLYGHTAAQIQPRWIEPLAGHLLKRTYSEPHWERKPASVMALERATLYGVPAIGARKVPYGPIDPVLSREMFIRHALLEGDWTASHRFLQDNRHLLEEVEELEHRVRRRDIVATGGELYDFYDARIPQRVVSGAHFDRWWKDARRREPQLLRFTRELLVGDAGIDEAALPDVWRQGDVELALTYRFEPGTQDDGITVHVPLHALQRLRPAGFDWLVPGLREELVTALIRSLPKDLRRPLVPIPETAGQVVTGLRPRRGTLIAAVARELERVRGVHVEPHQFDLEKLPAYLRVRFAVQDEAGAVLAAGPDLEALRAQLRPRLRAQLAAATAPFERSGLRDWSIGELPRSIALPGTGESVRAYPALVDEGDTVAVRAFETPAAQAGAMHAGTRRLLRLVLTSPLRAIQRGLAGAAALTMAGAPHGGASALLDDALDAAFDELIAAGGGPAWDEAGFALLRARVADRLPTTARAIVAAAVDVLDAATALRSRLDALSADPALQPARLDVAGQLGSLVHPGFITATGTDRLPDVVRYLRAASRRLERLPDAVAADRDRMNAIGELEREYRARGGRAAAPGVHWMLQELRVAQFAQGLGTRGAASAKQIRRALAASNG